MSLQIPIQKDIGEYEEKVIGKMSFRTLVCVAGGFGSAIAVACGCWFLLGVEPSNAAFPVMCASLPFWLTGFWRPYGIKAEKFAPLLAAHHINDQHLLYISPKDESLSAPIPGKPSHKARRSARKKGAEADEPTKRTED